MEKKIGFTKQISQLILSLCIYYIAGSFVSVIGFSFLESQRQGLEGIVIHGTEVQILLSGIIQILMYLVSALSVYSFYKREHEGNNRKDSFDYRKWMKNTGIFLAGGILAVLLNLVWARIPFFQGNQTYEEVVSAQYVFPMWFAVLLYGVASPLAEEIMFRGILYKKGRALFGKIPAVFLSSFCFGFFHGNMVQASYGFFMGLFMAALYEKENSLWAPFLFHSGANIAVYCFSNIVF